MNTDYYLEAVQSWQQANRNLKNFARCCYHVSEHRTQALAADCGVSHDTVNDYRNAYSFYVSCGDDQNERARRLWEKANIALWVKAAKIMSKLSLSIDKTMDYLQTATDHHMTRESFAAHIDEKENDTPKWIRRLRQAIRFLTPSKADYKSEMPLELQMRYDAAVTSFVAELEAIAAEQAQP